MRHRFALFVASAALNGGREGTLKKRYCLSKASFAVFSERTSEVKVVGSHRPRSRHKRFLVSFFASKKGKSVVKKVATY